MATVTAQQLIAAGLARADMTDATNAFIPHPTTAGTGFDAFTLVNAAISELYDILFEADAESFAATLTTFNSVANQADYPLLTIAGATFYHLRGIDRFDGFRWSELDRANWRERNNYPIAARPAKYMINGDNITILPTPNAVYAMRIGFVPNPPILAADVDTIDLKGPWREFIELHFCIAALDKEESDASTHRMKLLGPNLDGSGGVVARVRSAAKKRDNTQPNSPADVMGDDYEIFPTYPGGRIF